MNGSIHIPMLDLKREYDYMKSDIDSAIGRCLEHQHWIWGPEVKELEERVAEHLGARHCIGVSSGTDALLLSLRSLVLKMRRKEYFEREDKIITTPFTFTATGDAILRAGATPVFVDIDPKTYNIDPQRIRKYLERRPENVVGILPVHLYGQSCLMDDIMDIAHEHGLFVVEDVAQAFGASWRGKKLGSLGSTGTFSFFPSKNLGGFGDGGMVSTNDDEIENFVRMLIKHGGKDKYNVGHVGYNARIDTLQAAVLLAKLNYIEEFNERRRMVAQTYTEQLNGLDLIVPPAPPADDSAHHVYHQYTVRILEGKRGAVQDYLRSKGIDSAVYYPVPLHKMSLFDGLHKSLGSLAESERASQEVLSLPIEPLQERATVERTAAALREAVADL
jgi:dTDP-4-amino-4,6-dideoxygalactose transaminase